jgi:uncharacterized protein YsxB (DUF464 family)
VCAAVSVLLRTTLNVLQREKDVRWEGDVPVGGRAAMVVTAYGEAARERLLGITSFLLTGLFDLAAEHPEYISVILED